MSKITNYNNKVGHIITFNSGLGIDLTFFSSKLEYEINKINGYSIILNIDGFMSVGMSMEQAIDCVKENINEIRQIKNNNIVVILNINMNIGNFSKNIDNIFGFSFADWKHIIMTPNFALEERDFYTKNNINEMKELFGMYMGYTIYNLLSLSNESPNYVNIKTLPFSEKPTHNIVITSLSYEPVYFVNSVSEIYKIISSNRKKNLLKNYAIKSVSDERIKAEKYLEFLEKYYPNDNLVSKHKIASQDYDDDEDNEDNYETVSFIKSPLDICKILHLNSMKHLFTTYGQNCVFPSVGVNIKDNLESARIRHKKYSKYLEEHLPVQEQIDDIMTQIEFET